MAVGVREEVFVILNTNFKKLFGYIMKKLYSTITMLAMMVAALSLTACGGSDDDEIGGGGNSSDDEEYVCSGKFMLEV